MKNKILISFAALLLILSGGLMFACDKNDTEPTPVQNFVETVDQIVGDDEMFDNNFMLNQLVDTDYEYVAKCLTYPLKYINVYKNDVSDLNQVKLDKAASTTKNSLENNTTNLKQRYVELSQLQQTMKNFTEGDAYDSIFHKFLTLCQSFTESAFDVAFNVAEIENSVYKRIDDLRTTSEELKISDTENLKSYLPLSIVRDCFDLLVVNSGAEQFDAALFEDFGVQDALNALDMSNMIFDQNANKSLTSDSVAQLLNFHKTLQSERENLAKTLDQISLYDLILLEGDFEAYAEQNSKAADYVGYLSMYYQNLIGALNYYQSILF